MENKAIETVYNGYRFRSRLEARWAVFFDEMGIRYEYEKEGYEVNVNGRTYRYLPDFYFLDFDIYGEVKGVSSTDDLMNADVEEMEVMVDFGPCETIVFLGNIPNPHDDGYPSYAGIDLYFFFITHHKGAWYGHAYFEELFAKNNKAGNNADRYCLPKDFSIGPSVITPGDPEWGFMEDTPLSQKLKRALLKARQARFEHGETP